MYVGKKDQNSSWVLSQDIKVENGAINTGKEDVLSREKDGKEGMIINGLWGFEF